MSIYNLLNEARSSECLGAWHQYLGDFDLVVGYSILGAIFLKSSTSEEYLVLYPLRSGNNSKNYGKFESISNFEEEILKHPEFSKACLYPIVELDIESLVLKLGKLEPEQVYFPVPHPAVGGTWELNTYDKGNLWIFADIACQNHGW